MTHESAEIYVDRLVYEVGRRALALRKQHDYRQTELAYLTGLDQRSISKLECGNYKRVEFLISVVRFARYFKIHPSVFLFGTGRVDVDTLTDEAINIAKAWDNATDSTKLNVANLLLSTQ